MIHIERLRDFLEDTEKTYKEDQKIGRPAEPSDVLVIVEVAKKFLNQIDNEHEKVKKSLKHILNTLDKKSTK